MTILSSTDIKREIAAGNIVIAGGSPNIQNCSVDVTLGKHYFRHQSLISDCFNDSKIYAMLIPTLDPTDPSQVRKFWNQQETADGCIVIRPGETILAHTEEFIGGCHHITTMLRARSSMGRCNVTICRDAGWGDIGYINRWCLQITNNNLNANIMLPVGTRIGQIIFLYSSVPESQYQGQYQSTLDIEQLVANWKPENMLPSLV